MYRFIFSIVIILTSISCNVDIEQNIPVVSPNLELEDNQTTLQIDSMLLANAIDSIWNCAKVQAKESEIRKLSDNEKHLTILQFEQANEIFVNLAEDNGVSYATHLIFYITPSKNYMIEYEDPFNGKRIDFGEWCQSKKATHKPFSI